MTTGRLTKALAAASLAGACVLGAAAPALAQSTYEDGPGRSEQAPGQGAKAECPADPTRQGNPGNCGRGAENSASSGRGTFDPGSQGRFGVEDDTFRQIGTFATTMRVNPDGSAEVLFTVPAYLADGDYFLVFYGVKDGFDVFVRVPFTVRGGGTQGTAASTSDFVLTVAPGGSAPGSVAPGSAAAGAATAAAPDAAAPAGAAAAAAVPSTDGAANTVANGSALPRTGSDSLVELTAAGIALVALGGGVVVAARRRRDDAGMTAA